LWYSPRSDYQIGHSGGSARLSATHIVTTTPEPRILIEIAPHRPEAASAHAHIREKLAKIAANVHTDR